MPQITGSMNWYWSDYLSDAALALCSLAAQGLWARMLGHMALSEEFGYLKAGGKRVDISDLAQLVGHPVSEIEPLVTELRDRAVFSSTQGGVAYNRRMVRDARRAQDNREKGRRGGNPVLLKQREISARDNPKPRELAYPPPLKVARASPSPAPSPSIAKLATSEVASPRETSAPEMTGPDHHDDYRKGRMMLEPILPNVQQWRELNEWLKAGYDLLDEIVPSVSADIKFKQAQSDVWTATSLKYFTSGLQRFRERRLKPPPTRSNGANGSHPPPSTNDTWLTACKACGISPTTKRLTTADRTKLLDYWKTGYPGYPSQRQRLEQAGIVDLWEIGKEPA